MTASPPRSISVFGTFDVENYGDLLFPLLVRHELCRENDVLNLFSPLGVPVPWADTLPPRPVGEAAATRADLCIVGGGNIISAEPTPLPAYEKLGGYRTLAYPSLWLGAALVAAANELRLVWNAPGLPSAIKRRWARELCALTLPACDHVAVRDAQSRTWLAAQRPVSVVPDVALGLSRLWPAEDLAASARTAFLSRGVEPPPRWLVFHFNDRYLAGGVEEAVAAAGAIAAAAGAFPVLIAIGPCHGDGELARAIAARMPTCLAVDRPAGLKEVAGLIAHAAGYVGSSLHGLITALSYRRPAVAIARTSMPKFQGFLEQLGLTHRLLDTWSSALQAAPGLLEPLTAPERSGIDRGLGAVDRHWATLRACWDEPGTDAALARRALLAEARQETPGRWAWHALQAMARGRPMPCPICGNDSYGPGPGGRMSLSGEAPQCTSCRSLERHRLFRLVFDELRAADFSRFSCLSFSRDPTASAAWFASFEISLFEVDNSLDIQRIDRPDAAYDVVVCNHVLEHVPDYRAAIRELARITHPRGFLFLSFPNPTVRLRTVDWGYPRADQHGHFRVFGRDIEDVFRNEIPNHQVIAVTARDPVTREPDMAYIITHSETYGRLLGASGFSIRLTQPGWPPRPSSRSVDHPSNELEILAEQLREAPQPELGPRLQALVKQHPREPRPRLLLGEWFQRQGEFGQAAACFDAAMRDFPGNPWPAVRMLGLHLRQNALPQACDLYARHLRTAALPDNVRKTLLKELRAAIAKAGAETSLLPRIDQAPEDGPAHGSQT